jgi:aminoglycoside 6'-N-acetyltransferase
MEIAFRRLAIEDMQQLYLWLGRPHVAKWYANAPTSFAELVAKYAPRTEPGHVVQAFVVNVDRADCGYVQTYPIREFADYGGGIECSAGAAGVDVFIADSWRVGHGLGPRIVRQFVDEVVFGANGATECLADPDEGNLASIRAFEKAGFSRWKVVQVQGTESRCVMRRFREAA